VGSGAMAVNWSQSEAEAQRIDLLRVCLLGKTLEMPILQVSLKFDLDNSVGRQLTSKKETRRWWDLILALARCTEAKSSSKSRLVPLIY